MTLHLPCSLAALTTLTLLTLAAGPEPPATVEPVTVDDAPCVLDHASASRAVADAYASLARIHRARIPGPGGAVLMQRRIDGLIDRLIDVDVFARKVLRDVWELASPAQQHDWRVALDHMLRRRYLRGYTSPTQHLLAVARSDVSCRTASVRVTLTHQSSGDARTLDLALVYGDTHWRVYDVTLDGVSLVRTWRSRFARIFGDGGVDAVDAQLRLIRERYRVAPDDAPEP